MTIGGRSYRKEVVYGRDGMHFHEYGIDEASGGFKGALLRAFGDVNRIADMSWFEHSYKVLTDEKNPGEHDFKAMEWISEESTYLESPGADIGKVYSEFKFKQGEKTGTEYKPTRRMELCACVNHPGKSFKDGSSDENPEAGSIWKVNVERKKRRIFGKEKLKVSWSLRP